MDGREIPKEPQSSGRLPWGTIFGFAAVGLYSTLTILAMILFPETVSPLDTYLSRLGNAEVNPDGAIFYNLAVILGGLALIAFFIAISVDYSYPGREWLLRIALLAGVINGGSVLMSGVYAEHVNMDAHTTWSYLIFLSLVPVLLTFSIAFWGKPGTSRGISVYGFVVCAVDIFFLATILSGGLDPGLGSIMEWFSVFSYLVWVILVALDVRKSSGAVFLG